jgi:hypothetical protein
MALLHKADIQRGDLVGLVLCVDGSGLAMIFFCAILVGIGYVLKLNACEY